MKMFEKILECRLRKLVTVNNMQFGFSPGKGTTDAVFIIKQLQEKHLEVHKELFLTFVDLETAYDRVPRDLVYWCLRRRGVPEKLVRLVETTYRGASTVVRTTHGRTDEFPTKVGLYQGSGLSPFLFIVLLDVISEEFRHWDGEQGTKIQYQENGSDGQKQKRNKSKHQRQPRHEPQTGE